MFHSLLLSFHSLNPLANTMLSSSSIYVLPLLNYSVFYINFTTCSHLSGFNFYSIFIIMCQAWITSTNPHHSVHSSPIPVYSFINISDFFLGQKAWFFFRIRDIPYLGAFKKLNVVILVSVVMFSQQQKQNKHLDLHTGHWVLPEA